MGLIEVREFLRVRPKGEGAMEYKGEDIPIRTSQGPAGVGHDATLPGEQRPADWSSPDGSHADQSETIWADDVVLASLNHAYDLALAHRAKEVQIEHLLHALTLSPSAAGKLEDFGIATGPLRRESASVVATAIPVGLVNGRSIPHTSEALEHVLRQAAERAYSHHAPISIATLLEVMTDMKQDLTGLDLLRRHASRRTQRYNTADDSLPAVTSQPALAESHQSSRLDALEELVRNLTQELASERQRSVMSTRRSFSRLHPDTEDEALTLIAQRLETIEGGIEDRFADLAGGWVDIADRFKDLEYKVEHRPEMMLGSASSDALDAKLSAIERTFNLILDRLSGLERKLDGRAGSQADMGPVVDMIAGLESRTAENTSGTRAVFERISALEHKLDAIASRPAADGTALGSLVDKVTAQIAPIHHSMAALEHRTAEMSGQDGAVDELNSSIHALTNSVDQWRLDQTGDIGQVANRLQSVENEAIGLRNTVETMASNIGVVYAILARREENKSKFKNWLFGTDDWYTASWDTARWREQMIAAGSFVPVPRRRAKQAANQA